MVKHGLRARRRDTPRDRASSPHRDRIAPRGRRNRWSPPGRKRSRRRLAPNRRGPYRLRGRAAPPAPPAATPSADPAAIRPYQERSLVAHPSRCLIDRNPVQRSRSEGPSIGGTPPEAGTDAPAECRGGPIAVVLPRHQDGSSWLVRRNGTHRCIANSLTIIRVAAATEDSLIDRGYRPPCGGWR